MILRSFANRPLKDKAIALVVVLAVVVVLSLLVVGMVVAMRMERQAAHHFATRTRAELLAREGIEYVKSALIEAGSGTNRQWISMPGRIVTSTNGLQANPEYFDLFSGQVSALETNATDLNRKAFSDPSAGTFITGSANASEQMRVGWIYVYKDGTRQATTSPNTSDPANPVVGRLAYWTDDESARVNLNTAWRRQGNSNSLNHPSLVDLSALGFTAGEGDEIRNAAMITPFSSPGEPRRLSPGLASTLASNHFSITHYSAGSDLNPWGEPKIVLTTQSNNLPPGIRNLTNYSNYYLNILRDESVDPGAEVSANVPNIDAPLASGAAHTGRYSSNLNKIMSYMSRTNWPYGKGSFIDKYGYLQSLQIAMDILEYVRAVESTNQLLTAVRLTPPATPTPGSDTFDFNAVASDRTLRANPRNIMISEAALWINPTALSTIPNSTNKIFQAKARVELFLPDYSGQSPVDLNGAAFYYVAADAAAHSERANQAFGLNATNTTPSTTIQPGGYVTIDHGPFNITLPSYPATMRIRMLLYLPGVPVGALGNYLIWDIAPSSKQQASSRILVTVNSGTTPTWTNSSQVNDPRVNKFAANWYQEISSFGGANTRWGSSVGVSVPTGQPPQDTAGAAGTGAVSTTTLGMPARKGSPANPHGVVRSVAELGFIHTGLATNVPWRTLRLQPTPGMNTNTLPDWALLDLFTVPLIPNNSPPVVALVTNAIPGRINLNSTIIPFTNMSRAMPLNALLTNNTNIPAAQTPVLLSNIIHRNYDTTAGINYGGTNGYLSIGELAEIEGMADEGESSEQRLFGVADLATVQGTVFRVFAVGQALKQTPSGKLVVESDKSLTAILEQNGDSCRVLYFRALPY